MADDIVTSLREMATDRARYATHSDGCVERHLECAALRACDEIERLRAERDDHRARLAVEAVTAPDADYDTMVDSLQARLSDLHAEIERLRAALLEYGTRSHYECEDSWYSCPKSADGCCDDRQGDGCNCGADEHNAEVRRIVAGKVDRV